MHTKKSVCFSLFALAVVLASGRAPAAPLPAEYAPLLYVEGTSSAYVDTGLKAIASRRVVARLAFTSNTSQLCGWCSSGSKECFQWGVDSDGSLIARVDSACKNACVLLSPNDGAQHDFDLSGSAFYLDGVQKTKVGGYSTSSLAKNMFLFARAIGWNTTPDQFCTGMRLYSCQIYEGTTLVRDFVPAQRLSDSKAGLYDSVNATFYAPGGGDLGAGPVLAGFTIAGRPDEYGTPSPDYGVLNDVTEGASYTFTCPAVHTNDAQTIAATCTGFTYELTNGNAFAGSALSTSIVYTAAHSGSTLTWQWARQFKATVRTRCDGSEAACGEAWSDKKGNVSLTAPASPKAGFAFSHWECKGATVGVVARTTAKLRIREPVTVTAVYLPVRYVKVGGDDTADGLTWDTAYATPQVAIDAFSGSGGVIYLGEGTFTGQQTFLNVTNDVHVIGAGKGKTALKPTNAEAGSTVILAHPNGIVGGLSIIGNTKSTAVYFKGNAGRLEDCHVGTNSYLGVCFAESSTGIVTRCEIVGNVGSYGGMRFSGNKQGRWTYVENTLFKDNKATESRGSACFAYYNSAFAYVRYCTFIGNNGTKGAFTGDYAGQLYFYNCIFDKNLNTSTLVEQNFTLNNTSITVNHCKTFDNYGTSPIAGDLNAVNPSADDYHLRYASCCRDAAQAFGCEELASDLEGNPRLSGANADVGCYEFQETEAPSCDVQVSGTEFTSGSTVTFTAVCSTAGDYTYAWTLKDATGATVGTGSGSPWAPVVTACGYLTVELQVLDSAGETVLNSTTVKNAVLIRPAVTYVVPPTVEGAGDGAYPYDTWARATTNIVTALAAVVTNGTVMLSNGTHKILKQLKLQQAVTLKGFGGRDNTFLRQACVGSLAGDRILYVSHAQAVVEGLTLIGARANTYKCEKNNTYGSGVYVTGLGGTVVDCRITDCSPGNYDGTGSVYCNAANGRISRCIVDDNNYWRNFSSAYYSKSAGAVISAGQIDNCLVMGNSGVQCSGICASGSARVLNCTVIGNTASSDSAGGLSIGTLTSGKGLVQNCIVMGNKGNEDKKTSVGYPEWMTGVTDATALANISNSVITCTFGKDFAWPLGSTYVNEDPSFADASAGDYSLNGDSKLINAGTDYDGVANEKDLALMPRKSGSSVDVGVYEYDLSKRSISFTVSPRLAFAGNDVTMTGSVQGGEEGVAYTYDWEINATGKTAVARSGTGNPFVVNTLKPGMYDVKLAVTETVGGASVGVLTLPAVLQVAPLTNYVVVAEGYEGKGGEWPYDTPEKATTNIQTAVDSAVAGSYVCLVDGVHKLTRQLVIDKAITLCGQHGRDHSILEQTNNGVRVLKIDNENAVVQDLTIRKGRINTYHSQKDGDRGAGVWITSNGGTLRNCRVTDCAPSNYGSGVVYVESDHGLVTHCLIDDNSYWRYWSDAYGSGSAGVVITKGQIDNCLVKGNSGVSTSGISMSNRAKVLNCTIVKNTARSSSGGGLSIGELYSGFGLVQNVIAWGNVGNASTSTERGYPEWVSGVTGAAALQVISNSVITCSFGKDFAWPLGSTYVNQDPVFNDASVEDYTLNAASKLINAGTNYDGCEAEKDFAGMPRCSGAAIDVGCYEYDLSKRSFAFTVTPRLALAGRDVTCEATVVGGEESIAYTYAWTATARTKGVSGATGTGKAWVLNTLKPGRYDISLEVTETSGGTSLGVKTLSDVLQIGATTNYVVTAAGYSGNGGEWPYDTWDKATTNLHAALEAAVDGAVVAVGPGTHITTNALYVTNAITLVGLRGWQNTLVSRTKIKGDSVRVLYMNNAQSRVRGLTLTGGTSGKNGKDSQGLAVYIGTSGGTLDACRVTGNHWPGTEWLMARGAVYVAYSATVGPGGTVENCVIDNNRWNVGYTYNYYYSGGGVYLAGGVFRNNIVFNNSGCQEGGVGVYGPATVQNNTIISNHVFCAKGSSGMGTGAGGVSFATSSADVRFENNLMAYNTDTKGLADFAVTGNSGASVTNRANLAVMSCMFGDGVTCGVSPVVGTPIFRTALGPTGTNTNWRLRRRSPGYKAGLYDATWMAEGVDFYGEKRLKYAGPRAPVVDIGAAEADWRDNGFMLIVK